MKTLYRDCKQGIYAGTSVSFMVILFGALGAGLFFFGGDPGAKCAVVNAGGG